MFSQRHPISIALFSAVTVVSLAAHAAKEAPNKENAKPATEVQVQKVDNENVFKGFLGQLWMKLRAYGPKLSARDETNQAATVTAGIRGAENTGTSLKPYWKDDRSNDPAFVQEMDAFLNAQQLADSGKLSQAAQALDAFLKKYPSSALRPNAQFALGLVHAGLGDKNKGTAAMKDFVRENAKHPLVADANRVIQQLEKP